MDDLMKAPNKVVMVVSLSSLAAIGPLIWGGVELHEKYVEYQDQRYIKRDEALTIAQATDIRMELKEAAGKAKTNSLKLDRIIIDQARRDVWDAKDRISRLKLVNASRQDIRDAEERLDQAQKYYDCLQSGRLDCRGL